MKPQLGPSLPMVNTESQKGLLQFAILYYYKARAHPMMLVGLGTFYVVRYTYHEQCLLHLVIYVHQPNAIINQLYQLYTPLNHNCPACLGTKNPPCPLPAVWPGPGTMCPASGGVTWKSRTSRPWFGWRV